MQNAGDGLAKAIYSATFDMVVELTNAATASVIRGETPGGEAQVISSISVLDIFGFETLSGESARKDGSRGSEGIGGFEQLCINYANEKLQAVYNRAVFESELRYYEEDGLACVRNAISYPSHSLSLSSPCSPAISFSVRDNRALLQLLDCNEVGKPAGIVRSQIAIHSFHENIFTFCRFIKSQSLLQSFTGKI